MYGKGMSFRPHGGREDGVQVLGKYELLAGFAPASIPWRQLVSGVQTGDGPLVAERTRHASPIRQETIFSEDFHHLVLVRTDEILQVPLPFQAIQTEIDGVLDVRRLSPLLCQSLVAHRRFCQVVLQEKAVLPFFAAGKKEDGLFLMSCFPMSTQRTKAGLLARRFSRRTDTNP